VRATKQPALDLTPPTDAVYLPDERPGVEKPMKSLHKVLFGAAAVMLSGSLYAQPAPTPTPAPTPAPAAPAPAPAPADEAGATVASEQQAKLSVPEMQVKVKEYDEQNRGHLRHIEQLRMAARKQKDVIKLNCVNDKYLQAKALMNIVDGAVANLEVAIMGKDDEARYHEFTKITISSEKVRALRDEAEACVGEELTYLGDTVVEVKEPEIPDDPTDDVFDDDVEPPGYASPFD